MDNECNFQLDTQNVEQLKAFDLVANTNTCLFITGKAEGAEGPGTFAPFIIICIYIEYLYFGS